MGATTSTVNISDVLPHEFSQNDFKKVVGDVFYTDALFNKLENTHHKITREAFLQYISNITDCFLTHDWGSDENGRENHKRVSVINEALKKKGIRT